MNNNHNHTIRLCPTATFYLCDENGDEVRDASGAVQYYHLSHPRWHEGDIQRKIAQFEEGLTIHDMTFITRGHHGSPGRNMMGMILYEPHGCAYQVIEGALLSTPLFVDGSMSDGLWGEVEDFSEFTQEALEYLKARLPKFTTPRKEQKGENNE